MSTLTDLRRRAADAIQNGDAATAVADLTKAAVEEPRSLDICLELGQAQLAAGQADHARSTFEHALTLRARDATAYRGLAQAHLALGDAAQALAAFRHALAILPYDTYAAHMVSALSGETPSVSTSYIADLFDTYAESFDSHLTETLGYRTPGYIRDLLSPYTPKSLLDLGCGTGLVGAALRDRIATMDGVDIAAQMIRKARERDIYRHLRTGEAVALLATDPDFAGPYDLVAAGDVFVYLGDLDPIFAASAKVLAPEGLFVFSVETAQGDNFTLRNSGRYAHAPHYIAYLAEAHGFLLLEQQDITLRQERNQPVLGTLYLLRRP